MWIWISLFAIAVIVTIAGIVAIIRDKGLAAKITPMVIGLLGIAITLIQLIGPPAAKPMDIDAEKVYQSARALYDAGKYEEAIQLYNDVLRAEPDNKKARSDRGNSYYETDNYESALADFQYIVENIDKSYWSGYGNCGYCLYKLNRYKEAKEYLDAAINHVFDAYYFHTRALCSLKLGFFFDAAIDTGMAATLAPEEKKEFFKGEYETALKQVPFTQLEHMRDLFNLA